MPRMSPVTVVHRTNPRSRSVRVSISPAGVVSVTRHPNFPLWRAEQFVEKSQDWIEKQLRKLHVQKKIYELDGSKKNLLYRGMVYGVEVRKAPTASPVEFLAGKILVSPVENTPESTSRALERWLRSESEHILVKKIHRFAEEMGAKFTNVVFKSTTTRWGSCSSTGNINLHWRLIQAPDGVADYVIIHELAHRREMNHGPRFWKLVEKHDPEYRSHRIWLKKHGVLLHQNIWQ